MIILTGFKKFNKFKINLSEELVKNFPTNFEGHSVTKLILPVSWKQSLFIFKRKIEKNLPDIRLIILLGIHTRKKICLEQYSWNIAFGLDAEMRFKMRYIKKLTPFFLKTNISLKKLTEIDSNFRISYNPGSYLCNFIYYHALYTAKKKIPILFIHLPHNGCLAEYSDKIRLIMRCLLLNLNL